MARKAVPKKMGRTEAVIDWDDVADLCRVQSPGTEIAAYLGIDRTTLYARCKKDNGIDFSDFSNRNKTKGKAQLRRAQFNLAIEGDKTMQIWLGKQCLEQSESSKIEHSGTMITEQHVLDYSKFSDGDIDKLIEELNKDA